MANRITTARVPYQYEALPDPEPADIISADDRDILIRALHVYDAELIGLEEDRRAAAQRLCERLARPGRHWIAVDDE